MKKGSITVFLALALGLVVSLLCSGLESVKMAAARTQILNGLDIGLYSLFGQYEESLLRDFDLFAIDGTAGGKELDLAAVYDNLESYMEPVLGQNSQHLTIQQGGISGYQLLTDGEGEVFYQQVVQYMKGTLGEHGAQLLLEKMKERQKKTADAQEKGKEVESETTLEKYEKEMENAAQKSEEAMQKEQKDGEVDGFTAEEKFQAPDSSAAEMTVNPIPGIRRIRQRGILELAVPAEKGISDGEINKYEMVTGRVLENGLLLSESAKRDDSILSKLLYQQYLMEKLGNYSNPGDGALQYQIEYILAGKESDTENLKAMAEKLLLVREGVNAASLAVDSGKMAEIRALAAGIASAFLIPPAAVVIEGALFLCWSFGESLLDVRELFAGGKVSLIKTASDWQLSLQNLPDLLEHMDSDRKENDQGVDYEDYLQIFLLGTKKKEQIMRGMDMIEIAVRKKENWENFQMDHCITALEASVDIQANQRKVFTVTRKYYY